MATRYPMGANMKQTGAILGIAPEAVLRRVGLSATLADEEDFSVTAEMFFRLWDAMCVEADRPGVEMDLAMAYAHGPFIPAIFAFSCADTLALGLGRLSHFKALIGPAIMDVTRLDGQLHLTLRPSDPSLRMPARMGLFELLYIVECARSFTGVELYPVASSLPGPLDLDPAALAYLGSAPKTTDVVSLTFSPEDADRPLITRSGALWDTLEPGLVAQLRAKTDVSSMAARVRESLREALPGGAASIEDMARRLNLSKRSLQRRLSEEGTSFQDLLSKTRFDLAVQYLKNSDLSVPEISYLLGYRETSSFFRAFQSWTGMTPGDYRSKEAV